MLDLACQSCVSFQSITTGIWSKLHQNSTLKSESKLLSKAYIEMTSFFAYENDTEVGTLK